MCSVQFKNKDRIKNKSRIRNKDKLVCVYIFENEDLIVSIYPGMRAKSTPCFNC